MGWSSIAIAVEFGDGFPGALVVDQRFAVGRGGDQRGNGGIIDGRRRQPGHSGSGATTCWPAATYSAIDSSHLQTIDTAAPPGYRAAPRGVLSQSRQSPADHPHADT